MEMVPVSKSRVTLSENEGTLRAKIPARRNWFLLLFFMAWLGGWTVGGVAAIGALLSSISKGPEFFPVFLSFWLVGWLLGWLFVFLSIVWMLNGATKLEIDDKAFRVRTQALGLGWTKAYDKVHVKNLRVSVQLNPWSGWQNHAGLALSRTGGLSFDYGSRTIQIGPGLDETEARLIADRIQKRFGMGQNGTQD